MYKQCTNNVGIYEVLQRLAAFFCVYKCCDLAIFAADRNRIASPNELEMP